jgi:hypothetical protein
VGEVLFDPDNDSKRRDFGRPRPNARHSRSGQLRPVARPEMNDVGAASELLKPYDARPMGRIP